jgi:hypothetical protein
MARQQADALHGIAKGDRCQRLRCQHGVLLVGVDMATIFSSATPGVQ